MSTSKTIPASTLLGVCAILAPHRPGLTPEDLRRRLDAPDTELDVVDELLTVHDIAARFKVSKFTVRNWRAAGRLPAVKVNCRVFRYRLSDVKRITTASYATSKK